MIFEELELPNIPKRSRLHHLEPIAICTPYVEGLISYICRLAEIHCVSPRILIQKEILPSFRESYSLGVGEIYALKKDEDTLLVSSLPKPPYRKNPNEYGLLAWQYLEGLKSLTLRLDLQALIIPEAGRALSGMIERELGRDFRAWCPKCFQTWRDAEQPIYEPLLWSIASVTVCPCHCNLLQTRCPHCQKKQRPLTARTYVARCSQCSSWLGVHMDEASELKVLTTTEFEKQLRIAEQAMKFLNLD